jgi:hypothetical protein
MVTIAAICDGVALARLRQPSPRFPSLTSRLRVAIKSNPLQPDQIDAARDTAASVLLAPSAPPSGTRARRSQAARNNRNIQAGRIVMATLLGWAATRRRALARQTGV